MKIDYKKEYEEMLEIAINNKKLYEFETKETERLNNIIKEVREYIATIKDEDIQYTIGWVKQDILQILDKVDENK